jgi:Zn-dependent protease with chaperone function
MAPRSCRACRREVPLQYSNPQPPEGINVSERHPLRDFLSLAAAVVAIAAALSAALAFAATWIAPHVPFAVEQRLAAPYAAGLGAGGGPVPPYLRSLADRLARALALPPGVEVHLHYDEGETVNAFATLGGHVVVFRGLIAALPDENALAMVIAHEIAHVAQRHPVQALGRGLALGAVLSTVSAAAGGSVAAHALGEAGLLTALRFSREQERQADAAAAAALAAVYGHVGGADALFRAVRAAAGAVRPPAFLSTHPLDEERVADLARLAAARGWAADGPRTPLPAAVRDAVAAPR